MSFGRMKICGGFETLGSRVWTLGFGVSVWLFDLFAVGFLERVFMVMSGSYVIALMLRLTHWDPIQDGRETPGLVKLDRL